MRTTNINTKGKENPNIVRNRRQPPPNVEDFFPSDLTEINVTDILPDPNVVDTSSS